MGASHWCRRVVVALLALAAACGRPAPVPGSAAALRIADDAGDTVALAAPARRIASLIPATTELLFAIGAGPLVVGRTHWCTEPAAALRAADLGDGLRPNVEAILAARPDLVVLYHSSATAEAAARLRALGIAVAMVRPDRIADVPRLARALGTLAGRAGAADSFAAAFDRSLDTVGGRRPSPPSLAVVTWDQPPIVIGAGSFLSEVIARAGGRNAFDDLAPPSAPVSLEALAVRDPDFLLALGSEPPAWLARPEWRAVRAARERRVVRLPGAALDWPGPRTPAAIAQLARALDSAGT